MVRRRQMRITSRPPHRPELGAHAGARAVEDHALVRRRSARAARTSPRPRGRRCRAASSPRAAPSGRASTTRSSGLAARHAAAASPARGRAAQASSTSARRCRTPPGRPPAASSGEIEENGRLRASRSARVRARLTRIRKIQVRSDERPSNAIDPADDAEPGLLHDVIGHRRRPHVRARDSAQRRVVAGDQDHEGILVARTESLQQPTLVIHVAADVTATSCLAHIRRASRVTPRHQSETVRGATRRPIDGRPRSRGKYPEKEAGSCLFASSASPT